jgi:hypothetical protein
MADSSFPGPPEVGGQGIGAARTGGGVPSRRRVVVMAGAASGVHNVAVDVFRPWTSGL